MPEKIIRDPVHDVIAFRTERPVDSLLFRLLSCPEFQRLRRVRQLGMAALAYPGADHTRSSHSLGVMETARRMLAQLGRSCRIDEAEEAACLAASLLHDIGHGPFSHMFERMGGVDHERLGRQIIVDPSSDVNRCLKDYDAGLPDRVARLLAGESPRSFLTDILSSQLDADRLDYLLRDNLMTGSRYGDYDLAWLLHALTIDGTSNRLAVTLKGVSAVEAYLQSRYHMYRNVYFHKVVRSAEGMVKLALQLARRLAVQGRLAWPPRDHVVYKALLGQRLSTEEFIDLDDVSVLHCFKLWTTCDDETLASLCRGLLFRRLYKTIDLSSLPADRCAEALNAARAAVTQAGGDAAYDIFYDEPSDTPYESWDAAPPTPAGEILVLDRDNQPVSFAKVSPLSEAMSRELMFRRIHVAEKWKAVAAAAIAAEAGAPGGADVQPG